LVLHIYFLCVGVKVKHLDCGCLRTKCQAENLALRGGWIQLHIEELHNLYSAPIIISRSNRGEWDCWSM